MNINTYIRVHTYTHMHASLHRFAKYWYDGQGIQYRTLTKAYGILFVVEIDGQVCHTWMVASLLHSLSPSLPPPSHTHSSSKLGRKVLNGNLIFQIRFHSRLAWNCES